VQFEKKEKKNSTKLDRNEKRAIRLPKKSNNLRKSHVFVIIKFLFLLMVMPDSAAFSKSCATLLMEMFQIFLVKKGHALPKG